MKLEPLIETLGALFEGRATLESTQQALGVDDKTAKRLAIYQRFCASHRRSALRIFSDTRRAITERGGDWAALVERYFLAHPMSKVELNANGAHLPEFLLKDQAPAWIAELADFEWWEWLTQIARETPKQGIASTVEIRPYKYDLCAWLDAPEGSEPPLQDNLVVFWRDADDDVCRAKLSGEELQVLSAMHRGEPVPTALAETARDLLAARILIA
jgi:hypothetical protein